MRLHQTRLFSVLLLAAVLATACGGGDHAPAHQPTLMTVEAVSAVAEARSIPVRVELRGVVEAEKSAAITSRVTAMVSRVRIKAGDRVRKGQVLIDIDPATARGQVSQATGALAQAQAALSLAERNHERFVQLAAQNAASELELDMARMQFEQAKGAVEQAQGAVSAARSVAAESSVRAPFDGLVVRRMVEEGDLAAPGRPLLMLESERGRRLSVAVPASLINQAGLATGDAIEVRLDGRDDLGAIAATIVERSPAADPMSHSFDIKADLPATDGLNEGIASGGTGRAWISTDSRNAIAVPADALQRQGALSYVVTVDAQGRTESAIVTPGEAIGESNIEILSGLSGGETVLRGLRSLPPTGSPFKEAS